MPVIQKKKDGERLLGKLKEKLKKKDPQEAERQKRIKAQKKRAEKRRANFKGQSGFVNDDGYVEFDGYVYLPNVGYLTIFDVEIAYGTHNPESIGWFNKIIPSQPMKHGKIALGLREKGMGKKTEDETFSKKLTQKAVSLDNTEMKDFREGSKKDMQYQDLAVTKQLAKEETIIDSDAFLIVYSDTPENLEETVKELKQTYKDDAIKGIMLVRRTSHILDTHFSLFTTVSADAWHNSDMQTVASNRLFLPSSGFSDEHSTYCGIDVHSLIANNASLIDFSGIRNAVVMTGGINGNISIGGVEGVAEINNMGSAWAHVIVEDNWLSNGTRTHFINLVPFDYHFENSKVLDMTQYTINPLEVYGTKKTVEVDTNANIGKVTEMLMMLIESDTQDPEIKSMLRKRLYEWMVYRAGGNGIYTQDPKNEPTKAWKVLANADNHKTYPTVSDFATTELNGLVAEKMKEGELSGSKARLLQDSVQTTCRLYSSIFSEHTNVPDSFSATDRNIYYDLSHVTKNDPVIRGVMFLNVLAYVVNRAQSGDMVVVTGIDSISINPKILKFYRDVLDGKGIGLITTFEERENEKINVRTLDDFVHPLSTQDLIVIGGITPKSEENINYSWNRSLSKMIETDLSANMPSRFFVYRARDFGSAVIDTHLIL